MSMVTPDSSTNAEDSWGPPSSQLPFPARRVRDTSPVRDDWDADDDDEHDDAKGDEDAHPLWESANARTPMPPIQLSSTSTTAGAPLPPAAAFETPMRILKRPTSGTDPKSPSQLESAQATKSLKEREAQYRAARERIFGEEKPAEAGNERPTTPRAIDNKSGIIRDPIGPTHEGDDGEANRGFFMRKSRGDPEG